MTHVYKEPSLQQIILIILLNEAIQNNFYNIRCEEGKQTHLIGQFHAIHELLINVTASLVPIDHAYQCPYFWVPLT